MSDWTDFITSVQKHVSSLEATGCDVPFFRGHSHSTWKLLSGLGRRSPKHFKRSNIESILYYDFISLAGPLLDRGDSSWDTLFTMQHHGLPTRLLDWSTTFAVALYFAVRPYVTFDGEEYVHQDLDTKANPCVWILNPFKLNKTSLKNEVVLSPNTDLEVTYFQCFVEEVKKFPGKVAAFNPPHIGRRLAVQKGAFTFHADLFTPLEEQHASLVTKVLLPRTAIGDARAFLSLAGISEFSLFPDLDGLARHLNDLHVR